MIRFTIFLLVVLAAVLILTNPNQETHQQNVYASMAANSVKGDLLGKITADVLGTVDPMPLTYHNYYLFSTTTFEDQTASVGIFSRVWKKDLSLSDVKLRSLIGPGTAMTGGSDATTTKK